MIGKKMISEKFVPLFEVKELLSIRNKEDELTYEQQQAFDYSKKFAKITPAKGTKLLKELQAIEDLDEDFIVKAIDVLPKDVDSARLIFYKTSDSFDEEKLKQVVAVTSKYAK